MERICIQNNETKSKDHLVREIAREAAREAVRETLMAIGIDTKDPKTIQADLLYLSSLRKSREYMSMRIKAMLIGVSVPAFLYLVWEVLKVSLAS